MDPEVAAALIGAPAVIISAAAAWSAGRASGRGAGRGPVEAIRRSAQRDAYAALLSAVRRFDQAIDASGALQRDRRPVVRHSEARECWDAIEHAADLVLLEGPDSIAESTEHLLEVGGRVYASSLSWNNPLGPPTQEDAQEVTAFRAAITCYVQRARQCLNGYIDAGHVGR